VQNACVGTLNVPQRIHRVYGGRPVRRQITRRGSGRQQTAGDGRVVIGSIGLISNNKEAMSRVRVAAATRPKATPTAVRNTPCRTTMAFNPPSGAPSAMRIPSSRSGMARHAAASHSARRSKGQRLHDGM
jgi:hypothetical protein